MPPKYRILYVNNEIPLPEPGKRFLEKDGQFSVESSTSAPAALSLLGSKDYDAIVSGYRMPEMDGIEFLKKCTIFRETPSRLLFSPDRNGKRPLWRPSATGRIFVSGKTGL